MTGYLSCQSCISLHGETGRQDMQHVTSLQHVLKVQKVPNFRARSILPSIFLFYYAMYLSHSKDSKDAIKSKKCHFFHWVIVLYPLLMRFFDISHCKKYKCCCNFMTYQHLPTFCQHFAKICKHFANILPTFCHHVQLRSITPHRLLIICNFKA